MLGLVICITEKHYVSTFFTRLWSIHKDLISDTHFPEILDSQLNIKPNGKKKLKKCKTASQEINTFWKVI